MSCRRYTNRVARRVLPLLGVNAIATRTLSEACANSARAAAFIGQTIVTTPARDVALPAEHTCTRAARTSAAGAVPITRNRPEPETRTRIPMLRPIAVVESTRSEETPFGFGVDAAAPAADPALNSAATERAWSTRTEHVVAVLEHAPPQPMNDDPDAGVAVSTIDLPAANAYAHVAPQSIPAGDDVTVPEPLPCLATVRVYDVGVPSRGHGSRIVPLTEAAAE